MWLHYQFVCLISFHLVFVISYLTSRLWKYFNILGSDQSVIHFCNFIHVQRPLLMRALQEVQILAWTILLNTVHKKRYILYKKIYLICVKSSIHQTCDMQQQKANKGGVITNSLRNNYSRHHLYTRTRRSWAISTGHPAEFFRIHILVRGQSLCIADICPNHTTGGGVLFWVKVLFSLGVLAHFDQFRLFCCEFTHFSVYFSQA